MAAGTFKVSGAKKISNNILAAKNTLLGRIAEAVEKTAVDVSSHAKANHVEGQAHAEGRFERDTGTLVRSITPELEEVSFKKVSAVVFTNIDYAIPVEMKYPYMFPALMANASNLMERLKKAGV